MIYVMTRLQTTVRIDSKLLEEAKRRGIRISRFLEYALRQLLDRTDNLHLEGYWEERR